MSARPPSSARRAEYGDYQTPLPLARAVCHRLASDGIAPDAIIEPTCGDGAFLVAAAERWPEARRLGVEIDPEHLARARAADPGATLVRADAFTVDWAALFAEHAAGGRLLVLGNPPWVTSAGVGALDGTNRPTRQNPGLSGLDALTGRSNFDVSEWLTLRWLDALGAMAGADDHGMHHIALLVKTSTIRRVASRQWRDGIDMASMTQHGISARRWFDAAVDAGLFVGRPGRPPTLTCTTHPDLEAPAGGAFGWRDGHLVADSAAYDRARPLLGGGPRWRSGVKHDCAKVLELRSGERGLVNGLGEPVDVEPEVLHPLMKSADVAHRRPPRRWLVLPHTTPAGDPAALQETAPRAWAYLQRHGDRLDARRSAIYRNRPRFSVFGVGPYTFAHHVVAVSGLYRPVRFAAVGPIDGRPVLFDDTVYTLPCTDAAEAEAIVAALESPMGRTVIEAISFPQAKRPITATQLGRIDLPALREYIISENIQ